MKVLAPISVGELLDKITILDLKRERIKDDDKLKHVINEYIDLMHLSSDLDLEDDLFKDLKNINSDLWYIESDIREKEKNLEFDEDFIELARMVYVKNDIRSRIKNDINKKYDSYFIEQKSY